MNDIKCFVMVLLCCLLVAGTAFAKTGTLLVAFGTSMDSARPAIDDTCSSSGASRMCPPPRNACSISRSSWSWR